jgi:hypothetical protein
MNMIVKYVYDKSIRGVIGDPIFMNDHQQEWVRVDKGKLIGVVVAIGKDKLGWSKCDDRDHFNKRVGKDIAVYRAIGGNMGILPKRLKKDFEWVQDKASKRRWD